MIKLKTHVSDFKVIGRQNRAFYSNGFKKEGVGEGREGEKENNGKKRRMVFIAAKTGNLGQMNKRAFESKVQ